MIMFSAKGGAFASFGLKKNITTKRGGQPKVTNSAGRNGLKVEIYRKDQGEKLYIIKDIG